jgi:hypothetical protein
MAARFRLVKYYNLPRLVKLGQIWKDIKHILQKREREREQIKTYWKRKGPPIVIHSISWCKTPSIDIISTKHLALVCS